MQNFIFIM